MDRRRLGIVMIIGAAIAASLILAYSMRDGSPVEPDLERVNLVAGGFAGAIAIGESVWMTTSPTNSDGEFRLVIVELDLQSGRTLSTTDLGPGWFLEGLDQYEGDLMTRRRGVTPGVPTVELPENYPYPETDFDALLRIDPETMEIVKQFELPHYFDYDPLTLIDGTFWLHGTNYRATIDLESGATRPGRRYSYVPSKIFQARRQGGELWVVTYQDISAWDLETGANVAYYHADDLRFGFKYHNGAYWVLGERFDELDIAYEYDLETGALSNPIPANDLPVQTIDAGEYRWDLYRDDAWLLDSLFLTDVHPPEPADVWHQVDPDTGETIARYRFGEYTPRFGTPGYLWLSRYVDGGTAIEVARLALPEPH